MFLVGRKFFSTLEMSENNSNSIGDIVNNITDGLTGGDASNPGSLKNTTDRGLGMLENVVTAGSKLPDQTLSTLSVGFLDVIYQFAMFAYFLTDKIIDLLYTMVEAFITFNTILITDFVRIIEVCVIYMMFYAIMRDEFVIEVIKVLGVSLGGMFNVVGGAIGAQASVYRTGLSSINDVGRTGIQAAASQGNNAINTGADLVKKGADVAMSAGGGATDLIKSAGSAIAGNETDKRDKEFQDKKDRREKFIDRKRVDMDSTKADRDYELEGRRIDVDDQKNVRETDVDRIRAERMPSLSTRNKGGENSELRQPARDIISSTRTVPIKRISDNDIFRLNEYSGNLDRLNRNNVNEWVEVFNRVFKESGDMEYRDFRAIMLSLKSFAQTNLPKEEANVTKGEIDQLIQSRGETFGKQTEEGDLIGSTEKGEEEEDQGFSLEGMPDDELDLADDEYLEPDDYDSGFEQDYQDDMDRVAYVRMVNNSANIPKVIGDIKGKAVSRYLLHLINIQTLWNESALYRSGDTTHFYEDFIDEKGDYKRIRDLVNMSVRDIGEEDLDVAFNKISRNEPQAKVWSELVEDAVVSADIEADGDKSDDTMGKVVIYMMLTRLEQMLDDIDIDAFGKALNEFKDRYESDLKGKYNVSVPRSGYRKRKPLNEIDMGDDGVDVKSGKGKSSFIEGKPFKPESKGIRSKIRSEVGKRPTVVDLDAGAVGEVVEDVDVIPSRNRVKPRMKEIVSDVGERPVDKTVRGESVGDIVESVDTKVGNRDKVIKASNGVYYWNPKYYAFPFIKEDAKIDGVGTMPNREKVYLTNIKSVLDKVINKNRNLKLRPVLTEHHRVARWKNPGYLRINDIKDQKKYAKYLNVFRNKQRNDVVMTFKGPLQRNIAVLVHDRLNRVGGNELGPDDVQDVLDEFKSLVEGRDHGTITYDSE